MRKSIFSFLILWGVVLGCSTDSINKGTPIASIEDEFDETKSSIIGNWLLTRVLTKEHRKSKDGIIENDIISQQFCGKRSDSVLIEFKSNKSLIINYEKVGTWEAPEKDSVILHSNLSLGEVPLFFDTPLYLGSDKNLTYLTATFYGTNKLAHHRVSYWLLNQDGKGY
ncbi:MAG: hypothetical protein MK066_06945 [Crocinitomicaceae bacterium]|nr:hypothetical protein [Crocinitomicaceae bacterium]